MSTTKAPTSLDGAAITAPGTARAEAIRIYREYLGRRITALANETGLLEEELAVLAAGGAASDAQLAAVVDIFGPPPETPE